MPVKEAFRKMQIVQRKVRGSEAEKDGLIPKFLRFEVVAGLFAVALHLEPS